MLMYRQLCRATLGVAAVVLLAGCPSRVERYSPRIPDSEAHRQAVQRKNCLECHRVDTVPHHSVKDECTKCHIICRGC